MYNKIKADSLVEKIRDILFSKHANKDNPLTERQLTKLFGVSRVPVRESLKELEKDGIIERKQNKGIYIRPPLLREIVEVYDLRTVLEEFAIERAVENITKEDIRKLENIYHGQRKAIERREKILTNEIDIEFHHKIAELSRNSYLVKIIENFHILVKAFELTTPLNPIPVADVSAYNHEKILEALKERDKRKCARIMKYHIQRAKNKIVGEFLRTYIG